MIMNRSICKEAAFSLGLSCIRQAVTKQPFLPHIRGLALAFLTNVLISVIASSTFEIMNVHAHVWPMLRIYMHICHQDVVVAEVCSVH